MTVSPSSGTAPLVVTASAAGSTDTTGTITATSIDFGDGAVVSAATASHTYSKAGTFTVKATVADNAGLSSSASKQVIVSAPATSNVVVTSPAAGATVSSPVHFVASASAPDPMTAMKIYVDSIGVYTVNAAKLDTSLTMAKGSHNVTVKAWDNAAGVYSKSFTITVN